MIYKGITKPMGQILSIEFIIIPEGILRAFEIKIGGIL
jgi:hypothetical protein